MVSANLIILKIILFTVLTNGQTNNPYFICVRREDHTEIYDIIVDRKDDSMIVVNCINATTVGKIIDHVYEFALVPSLTIYFDKSILHRVPMTKNVGYLDLSDNNLNEVDLQDYHNLYGLNLTSNKIRSLTSVKLPLNVTLDSLDMSRNRLLKFEHDRLPSARKLYLRSNNIFELPSDISLPEPLEELDLTRNEIENLTDVIISSRTLRVLNLSINLISAFSYDVIEHLPNLEVLVLECNKILDLEPGTFSKNVKLTELNLRDNNLSTIKKGVFENLTNLQSLDISKNNLLQLTPELLQNLHNLMDFSVSDNHKLCQYACKRNLEFLLVLGGRLRTLKMNNLRMRKFPITLTTSIRHLDLSQNKLNAVQLGNLENFPYLVILILTDNEIESVETQVFSSMESLLVLMLDLNRLTKVPPSLPSSLIHLRLDRNDIRRLDKNSFTGLAKLQILKIESNSIESVEPGSMLPLRSLRELDISNNPILKLSTDSWEGLNSLRVLVASNLQHIRPVNVTDVRFFPTSEMRNLRKLNLARSPLLVQLFLADLPLLATVNQLETLDFSYTNLTSIPKQIQRFLPRLKVLRLRGNPITCSFHWFADTPHDYNYRGLLSYDADVVDNRTNYRLKVRIRLSPRTSGGGSDYGDSAKSNSSESEGDCCFTNFMHSALPSEEFWSNVNRTRSLIRSSWSTPSPSPSRVRLFPSHTQTTKIPVLSSIHRDNSNTSTTPSSWSSTEQKIPSSTYPAASAAVARYQVHQQQQQQSTRKKLNTRSLHIAQFSKSNNTAAANRMNISRISTTIAAIFSTIETKLPSSTISMGHAASTRVTTSLHQPVVTTSSLSSESFKPATLIVTTEPLPTAAQLIGNSTVVRNYTFITKSPTSSSSLETASASTIQHRPLVQHEKPSSRSTLTTVARPTYKNHSDSERRLNSTSTRAHYESLVWNQTNDFSSFFDWFPALNESAPIESAAAADLAERSIKAHQDSSTDIQYATHPGLVIFSAITCFLLVIFVSLIAPPYVQKYRWRRKRYKMSQFDNECQRSIEISSISAFVETEIPLE